ncbi:Tfp pilus assembly protein PilN [Candidatus Kryptobacter tengchongensis]|nr:hypothetical protein [Candidatus Kryptobacter tengchongensis]CUS83816.1 Tfp pilus assembly protein PilN [Candidatus Kryptobacter tengchongensis]CUU01826.1 Tfp pilus assembly protein PilN [Candidatus Kryptobacter tengchongensis]CUU03752.1 Tfp pilus assembly protein PilN [Candidatus Kryptobacter tengchongensis]
MPKNKKFSGKLAVGVFIDGLSLQVACLARSGKKIRFVDAQIVNLATKLEATSVGTQVFEQIEPTSISEMTPIDITSETSAQDLLLTETGRGAQDNASIIIGVLSKYPKRKYKLAISIPEPYVYYANFESNWGLKGNKLKEKIIEEISKERAGEPLKPDAVNYLEFSDGSIIAMVRDSRIALIDLLDSVKKSIGGRIPKISFIETPELSLVNLVKLNYKFNQNAITVIIYIGHEFSRFIFLKGNELYHISPPIGEGVDSYNIANTVYSRLMLEQDNLGLRVINNIILAGEAQSAGVKEVLEQMFPEDVSIDYIKFPNLSPDGADPLLIESLPRVAVAIGSAWRTLEIERKDLYAIDLTPFEVREGQKVFKLGLLGWLFLILIPLLTFQITTRIAQLNRSLSEIQSELQRKRSELAELQGLQQQVDMARQRLAYYKSTFGVLDSMKVNTDIWSKFLEKIATEAQNIGRIWITDISAPDPNTITIKGYSLYRNRIPRFSNAISNATLMQVQVQEIRGKTVYQFEIKARITPEVVKSAQK